MVVLFIWYTISLNNNRNLKIHSQTNNNKHLINNSSKLHQIHLWIWVWVCLEWEWVKVWVCLEWAWVKGWECLEWVKWIWHKLNKCYKIHKWELWHKIYYLILKCLEIWSRIIQCFNRWLKIIHNYLLC